MTRTKRLFAFVLCLMFIVSTLAMPAAAAKPVQIKNFSASTKLTYKEFNAMRYGKMTVEKYKGELHYKFTHNGNVVYVHPKAFTSGVGNDYSDVNKKLTSNANSKKYLFNNYTRVFYRERSTGTMSYRLSRSKMGTTKTYTTSLMDLYVQGGYTSNSLHFQCEKKEHVEFIYRERVRSGYNLKKPTTAQEYKSALTIITNNRAKTKVTPTFEVRVKGGDNKVNLQTAVYSAKGHDIDKKNITDNIDVVLDAVSLTKGLSFSNLYKLGKSVIALQKKSDVYSNNLEVTLSPKSWKQCYATKLHSVANLKEKGDYHKAVVTLSDTPTFPGYKYVKKKVKGKTQTVKVANNPTQFAVYFTAK